MTLEPALADAVATAIADATGREASPVASVLPAAGGCISAAAIVTLADGRRYFLKWEATSADGTTDGNENDETSPAIRFAREAEGLRALAAAGAIRVPAVVALGDGGHAFLVLEAIDEGARGGDFFVRFGRAFAALHRATRGRRFGFAHDNFIGATPQPNGWLDDGCAFWQKRRLGYQLALARERGLSDRELDRLGDRALDRLGRWLDLPDEPACLLHGDLWSGNYLAARNSAGDGHADGEPVLIDPAVYHGHREADLAMTRLFGGFSPAFYDAYHEAWPLAPGAAERLPLYQLYHLLNHLNLFGRGYRDQCVTILRRYA